MRSILVGCLVLAACGGGGNIALDDLETQVIDAQCGYYVRCGLFANTADCEVRFGMIDPNLLDAVDAGKIKYDGGKAYDCLHSLENASCDSTQKSERVNPKSCQETFTGTITEGGQCAFDEECVSAHCQVPGTCTMACCIGACGPSVALAKVDQSCAAVDCEDGLFCNASNVCQHLLAADMPCEDNSQCNYGLGCAGGTCKTLPHIGDACPDGDCAEINAQCNASSSCVALGLPGAACATSQDCSFFYTCDTAMGKCTAYPTRGMACTTSCGDDSWCNVPTGQAMGTCDAPKADGATCSTSRECTSRHCDTTASPAVCAQLPVCL